MKDIKILIAGNDMNYIETLSSVLFALTDSVKTVNGIDNAFNELSNFAYDFFITDYSLFDKDFSINSVNILLFIKF